MPDGLVQPFLAVLSMSNKQRLQASIGKQKHWTSNCAPPLSLSVGRSFHPTRESNIRLRRGLGLIIGSMLDLYLADKNNNIPFSGFEKLSSSLSPYHVGIQVAVVVVHPKQLELVSRSVGLLVSPQSYDRRPNSAAAAAARTRYVEGNLSTWHPIGTNR